MGKFILPEAALEIGLIDELGSFEDTLTYLDSKITNKTNTQNPIKMNKSFPKLEAVLEVQEGFSSNDNGIYLNEDQFDALENKLTDNETEIQEVLDAKKLVDDEVIVLKDVNTSIIDETNTVLELEGDAKVTDVSAAFLAMKNKIATLGEQPGETHTNLGEDGTTTPKNPQMNFNTPFYNKTRELLN